jgi:uncharacterized membrane protein YkvA (DUF1232 family)
MIMTENQEYLKCPFCENRYIEAEPCKTKCPKCGSIQTCNNYSTMARNIIRFGLLARLLQNFRLLAPLIKDYWKGNYRDVSTKSIVIFVVALIYIISPIDLIPDYLIGLGQIDDAAILGLSLYFLEKELRKYEEWKDGDG